MTIPTNTDQQPDAKNADAVMQGGIGPAAGGLGEQIDGAAKEDGFNERYRRQKQVGQGQRDGLPFHRREQHQDPIDLERFKIDHSELLPEYFSLHSPRNPPDRSSRRVTLCCQLSGGDLEKEYNELDEDSRKRPRPRPPALVTVSVPSKIYRALFSEWRTEIKQYASDSLRQASQRKCGFKEKEVRGTDQGDEEGRVQTRAGIDSLRDQVLFMKHNLNARAIARLERRGDECTDECRQLVQRHGEHHRRRTNNY